MSFDSSVTATRAADPLPVPRVYPGIHPLISMVVAALDIMVRSSQAKSTTERKDTKWRTTSCWLPRALTITLMSGAGQDCGGAEAAQQRTTAS